MSLAQLLQVKPPSDFGALTLADLKPTEKPVEDFMAVLDRALADRPATQENPTSLAAPRPLDDAGQRPVNQVANELSETVLAEKRNAVARSDANAAATAAANSPWVEKYRTRPGHEETVKTLQREGKQIPHPGKAIDGRTAVTEKAAKQNHLEEVGKTASLAVPVNFQPVLKASTTPVPATQAELPTPASRKINSKISSTAVTMDDAAGKELKHQPKTVRNPRDVAAESAAVRMQLHADTGGTKGLQDAMSVVKNLARNLGLDTIAADTAKVAGRSIEVSRNLPNVANPNRIGNLAKSDRADPAADAKSVRVDMLRNERLGKKGPEDSLRMAADNGRVQVLDLRGSGGPTASLVLENMVNPAQTGRASGRADDSSLRREGLQLVNASYMPAAERNTVTMPMYLTGSQAGNLHQNLRNHLSQQGNGDIVQQARIVMNGKDTGEIRLILKPESLGEVRIHLQMQDGHIAGKIFVENKEVQAAFEDNMPSLMQAFQDGGLDMGAMQVAVDGRNADSQGFNFQERQPDERQKLYAVGRLENSVATVNTVSQDYSQINLVV